MVDGDVFSEVTIIVRNLYSLRFYNRGLIHMDIYYVRRLVGKQGEEHSRLLLDAYRNNDSKVIVKA